jgi:fructose-1,6-bisphosphatase II
MATRIVAGEGEKDKVEHLEVGEVVLGTAAEIGLDLAVDPIEGTTNLAYGLPWALSVAAAVPHGKMFETGPSLYMDKLVVPRAAAGRIDPEADTASRLASLSSAIGKPVSELRVFVLDKPRHRALIAEIVAVGASVAHYSAGDVVGTCAVAMEKSFDAVMGIGGTPEGMLSACAVRALDGGFFARLAPQRPDEADAMKNAGLSSARWMSVDEMVQGDFAAFCAAGITESLLTPGIDSDPTGLAVHSIVIESPGRLISRRASHIDKTTGVI